MRIKQQVSSRQKNVWLQIVLTGLLPFIVGGVLGVAATTYVHGEKLAKMEEKVQHLESSGVDSNSETSKEPSKVNAGKLVNIIQDQQRSSVKESCGVEAYQCFTDSNLNDFIKTNVPTQITEKLKANNEFIEVVLSVQAMRPNDQQKLLSSCQQPLRKTWAQLGRISCEGQTDAGQRAEVLIASAIVDLIKELIKLPPEEIKKLYV